MDCFLSKKYAFSNSGINKVAMVINALLPMSLYSLLWVSEIIRYHLHIHSRHELGNLTNFYLTFFFIINVTIRDCNFAMGTILGKGFAQALVHTSQCLCLRHSCCDLYALVVVQNPFPRLSPW